MKILALTVAMFIISAIVYFMIAKLHGTTVSKATSVAGLSKPKLALDEMFGLVFRYLVKFLFWGVILYTLWTWVLQPLVTPDIEGADTTDVSRSVGIFPALGEKIGDMTTELFRGTRALEVKKLNRFIKGKTPLPHTSIELVPKELWKSGSMEVGDLDPEKVYDVSCHGYFTQQFVRDPGVDVPIACTGTYRTDLSRKEIKAMIDPDRSHFGTLYYQYHQKGMWSTWLRYKRSGAITGITGLRFTINLPRLSRSYRVTTGKFIVKIKKYK